MTQPSSGSREAHLASAHRAHDERRFEEAAAHYRSFVAAGGSAADVGVALGDVLVAAGDLEGGVAAYAAVIEGGRNLPAAVRLGQAAQRLGRFGLTGGAWRAAAVHARPDNATPIGGEVPLAEDWDAASDEVLRAQGWPRARAPALHAPAEGAEPHLDLAPRSSELRLLAIDPPDLITPPAVVASVLLERHEQGSGVVQVAQACSQAVAGDAIIIAHLVGAGHGELETLRRLIRLRRLPIRLALHATRASPRAMRNLDLLIASAWAADALLFDSVPDVFGPSCERPLQADPLLGFASWRTGDAAASSAEWRYGPMRPGAVTLVRNRVLLEAGLLDAVYDDDAQALLDLMLRANRMGFSGVSAAVASSASDGRPRAAPASTVDARILESRYPEHRGALERASVSPAQEIERLSAGLDRPRSLALDLSGLRAWHDGTSELSVALTRALAACGGLKLTAICTAEAAHHHGLDALTEVRITPPDTREVFGACLKIGQPFTWEELLRTWSYAPVAGFYMLDAISLDIERLDVADLGALWRHALGSSELVGHLSAFTRDQLGARFGAAGRRGFVALCSTAADEYGAPPATDTRDGPLLLVGNAYEHKNLMGAIRHIHAVHPTQELVVLGRVLEPRPHVTWLDSGGLSKAHLEQVYSEAAAVVFPSLYEGFGLPIMHGLARGKPVLAIDQPVFREIKARSQSGANLHLFETTRRLAEGVEPVRRLGFAPRTRTVREHRWADAARIVADAVREGVSGFRLSGLQERTAVAHLAAARAAARV